MFQSATPPHALRVESVTRALRILGCFDFEHGELGVSEIARMLGLHKSTVHRLLGTLVAEDYMRRSQNGMYSLSWKMLELGAVTRKHYRLHEAIEALTTLVEGTGETAHLATLDRGDVLYLEKVESVRALRMPSAVGDRAPTHCTALGKALLAGRSDAEVRKLLEPHCPLQRNTPDTLTTIDEVIGALGDVRKTGYAVDNGELEEGLTCIAAGITIDGVTTAAVSVSGPTSRLGVREVAAEVQRCAARLSAQFGRRLLWDSAPASEKAVDQVPLQAPGGAS
jgi:DNA-binding IclR family transcriptional regulator